MSARQALSAILGCVLLAACGGPGGTFDLRFLGDRNAYAGNGFSVAWRKRLTREYEGPYVPVERAVPALDPANDRIFVGSTAGDLLAMSVSGQQLYRYPARGAIEARPALDVPRNQIYVVTEQGDVHALVASTGARRWTKRVDGPIRTTPVLTNDAIYVVTDTDTVTALSREDGEQLWTYHRDPPEGFTISGHAGVTRAGNRLLSAFTDGTIAALDLAEGTAIWERDTSVDVDPSEDDGVPRFLDVDTTPTVLGDVVYVASFAGGLYALELGNGGVLSHDARYGAVTAITAVPGPGDDPADLLVLSSADAGVIGYDIELGETRWRHPITRGSPGVAVVVGPMVLVGESLGSFLALHVENGEELARLDAGHGFSASAAFAEGLGYVVSNGGALYALRLGG